MTEVVRSGTIAQRQPSGYPSFSSTEEDLLEQLNFGNFEVRLRALNRLRTSALKNPDWFKQFRQKLELFKAFGAVILDNNWEVQHQCLKLITDSIKDFGNDLEWTFAVLLPSLIPKLYSSKVTVKRATTQVLISYARSVGSVQAILKSLATVGLLPSKPAETKEILREIPSLFHEDLSSYNWSQLIETLVGLVSNTNDKELIDLSLNVLERLAAMIGVKDFNSAIDSLPYSQKSQYEVLLADRVGKPAGNNIVTGKPPLKSLKSMPMVDSTSFAAYLASEQKFRHGVIPSSVVEQINNDVDSKIRLQGLTALKITLETMGPAEVLKLHQHLFSFLNLISAVLDDVNLKVVVLTLDCLRITVGKIGRQMEPLLQQVVTTMSKHFGNQKSVVKQLNMMIVMELLQNLNPKTVVAAVSLHLQHRSSRVREEVLNIITAALLKFPSVQFNLTAVAQLITPTLADPRRRVRLAAFECVATLAQSMGQGKLDPLWKAVRDWELQSNCPGLTKAVQVRVARQRLPRIRYDGLLEYPWPEGFQLDSLDNSCRNLPTTTPADGLDVEWILGTPAQNNANESQRSLHSATSKAQSGVEPTETSPVSIRKVLSAGKNRKRLPWEEDLTDQDERSHHSAPVYRPQDFVSKSDAWQSSDPREELSRNQQQQFLQKLKRNGQDVSPTVESKPFNGREPPMFQKSLSLNNTWQSGQPHKSLLSPIDRAHSDDTTGAGVELKSPFSRATKSRGSTHRRTNGTLSPDENFNIADSTYRNRTGHNQPLDSRLRKTLSVEHLENISSSWGDDRPIRTSTKPLQNGNSNQLGKQNGHQWGSLDDIETAKTQISSPRKPLMRKNLPPTKISSDQPGTSAPPKASHSEEKKSPDQQLTTAMKKIANAEWTEKVEGIVGIQRLAESHPNVILSQLHTIVVALIEEAKNLRSSVSRQAIECFQHLFIHLKKNMDPELDKVGLVLMNKTGDVSSAFIREDGQKALEAMVDYTSTPKCISSLTTPGLGSKSTVIRASCAQLLLRIAENLGPQKSLSGTKDVTDKLLTAAAIFSQDSQPQARYHGKAILNYLSSDPEFDRAVRKYLSASQQKSVKDTIDQIRSKGLGDVPVTAGSAGSVPQTANSKSSNPPSRTGSLRRKKLPDEVQDNLAGVQKNLSSNQWEQRLSAVQGFESLCQTEISTVGNNIKLVDAYVNRLNDINGKVAMSTLENFPNVVPYLAPYFGDSLKTVVGEMVKNIMAQLPSKNEDIRRLALDALDATIHAADNGTLIQPFSMATKVANVRQKPEMLQKLGRVCQKSVGSKPKLVQIYAVPVLVDLFKQPVGDSAVKSATFDYAKVLSSSLGRKALLDQCNSLTPAQLGQLKDALDS